MAKHSNKQAHKECREKRQKPHRKACILLKPLSFACPPPIIILCVPLPLPPHLSLLPQT